MAEAGGEPAQRRNVQVPPTEEAWTQELEKYVLGRVGRVQTSAQVWLGTMTTLLGLFSALIVFNRGQSLADLPVGTPVRVALYLAVVLVYVCAFWAVLSGARATFGGLSLATTSGPLTWRDFRDRQEERADTLRRHLHVSRWLGVAAVLLVGILALSVLALGGFADDPPAPTYVVVVHDGEVTCGRLERTDDGRTLIGGNTIHQISQLTAVPAC